MVVANPPAITTARDTAHAKRISQEVRNTYGKIRIPSDNPISDPVRSSPVSRFFIGVWLNDNPLTATASVCVPMASAR